MSKKTILIICRNHLSKAPRFLMEVNALCSDYKIVAAGLTADNHENYSFFSLNPYNSEHFKNIKFHLKYPFLLKKIISAFLKIFYYKNVIKQISKSEFEMLKEINFDLIIVHHLTDLPLAVKLAKYKNVKLIFNAHEYYPLEFDDNPDWMKNVYPSYMKIAKKHFKHVEICFCVGEIIAKKYEKEFNLNSIVITNSKIFCDLYPKPISSKIRLIHHGIANRSRKIELMIDMMKYLNDNYTLDLMLVSNSIDYIKELKLLASDYSNINFIEPVQLNEIPSFTNNYDIGVFLLPPTNFNYSFALPNKFFEFIQARLAIAIGPSPEMASFVNKYELGIVADDFTSKSLAEKIKKLSFDQIMFHKIQSHRYADVLSLNHNLILIKNTVKELLLKEECICVG